MENIMDRELRPLDSVTTPFTDLTFNMQGLFNLSWKSLFLDITFTEKQLAFDFARASEQDSASESGEQYFRLSHPYRQHSVLSGER